ncbi:MAG TPA: MBL fold metallo-hydrolase [Solirubrobacteraceae bacterium]
MRIIVLGKSPAWQDTDGACSGYLVQEDCATVLLDCGCGVFSKLRRYQDYRDIDAVVISHLHADHVLDLVPYASALTYGPRQQERPARPRLFVPEAGREALRRVCGGSGMPEDHVERAFDLRAYSPEDVLEVGALRARLHSVPHYLPTCAVDVASADGGGRFTYGADTGPSDDLVRFAEGTDLLMLEATLPAPESEGPRGHLTPAEAGEHGARAHVGRLVLTHISDELDEQWARAEAERTFGAPVDIAREGAVYTV